MLLLGRHGGRALICMPWSEACSPRITGSPLHGALQGAAVSITGMRMLDNSAAEIRWRLTGKLGVFPVDIAGACYCFCFGREVMFYVLEDVYGRSLGAVCEHHAAGRTKAGRLAAATTN